jgi:hypothetical protein
VLICNLLQHLQKVQMKGKQYKGIRVGRRSVAGYVCFRGAVLICYLLQHLWKGQSKGKQDRGIRVGR